MVVHYRFNGKSVCGKNGEMTDMIDEVTCSRCRATLIYKSHKKEQESKNESDINSDTVNAVNEDINSDTVNAVNEDIISTQEAVEQIKGKEVRLHFSKKYERNGYTPAGSVSVRCGDVVSDYLVGTTLDGAVNILLNCADSLGVTEFKKGFPATKEAVSERYKKLNAGMIRMNIGNLLRGLLRRFFDMEDIDYEQLHNIEVGNIYVDENGELNYPDEMYKNGYFG